MNYIPIILSSQGPTKYSREMISAFDWLNDWKSVSCYFGLIHYFNAAATNNFLSVLCCCNWIPRGFCNLWSLKTSQFEVLPLTWDIISLKNWISWTNTKITTKKICSISIKRRVFFTYFLTISAPDNKPFWYYRGLPKTYVLWPILTLTSPRLLENTFRTWTLTYFWAILLSLKASQPQRETNTFRHFLMLQKPNICCHFKLLVPYLFTWVKHVVYSEPFACAFVGSLGHNCSLPPWV